MPYYHLFEEEPNFRYILELNHFYNVHRYYLNTAKKYTIKDLFEEWSVKELMAINTRKKFNRLVSGEITPLYVDKDLVTTSTFLKDTGHSIIFGQHAIDEGYTIKEDKKTILLFHYQFAEKLGIEKNGLFNRYK